MRSLSNTQQSREVLVRTQRTLNVRLARHGVPRCGVLGAGLHTLDAPGAGGEGRCCGPVRCGVQVLGWSGLHRYLPRGHLSCHADASRERCAKLHHCILTRHGHGSSPGRHPCRELCVASCVRIQAY